MNDHENHGDPLGQAKPTIGTPGKVLPWYFYFFKERQSP